MVLGFAHDAYLSRRAAKATGNQPPILAYGTERSIFEKRLLLVHYSTQYMLNVRLKQRCPQRLM